MFYVPVTEHFHKPHDSVTIYQLLEDKFKEGSMIFVYVTLLKTSDGETHHGNFYFL